MHEDGHGPASDVRRSRDFVSSNELGWWGGFGFLGGFVLTAVIAATIVGVGMDLRIGSASRAGSSDVLGLVLGERVYNTHCASCHGPTGAGNVGPAIGDGLVVEKYPFLSDQISVITNGQRAMPGFATTLSAEEIEAVALFEREKLGQ